MHCKWLALPPTRIDLSHAETSSAAPRRESAKAALVIAEANRRVSRS